MVKFTEVEYRYRDYGNWKFYGEFVLSGEFNWDLAKPFLFEETQFIPREVGLESLTPKEMNEDDHWLHEIMGTKIVSKTKAKPLTSSAEFMRRLKKASSVGWLELCPWV
jgi:hypothetical protein